MSTVKFFTFNSGLVDLSINDIAKAMYKEALVPNQYEYRDPTTGLSFQLISPTKLFIADPQFPVVKAIINARWQILYDATYSGPANLKFVSMGQDVTVSTNWKTLNDVLLYHLYAGDLPVATPEQVYMSVVTLDDSLYVVGTLFTPSQPYLTLSKTSSPVQVIPNTGGGNRIEFNRILDQIGTEEADAGQIVPVLTGANTGAVRLKVSGLYLVEATINLAPATVPGSPIIWDYNLSIRVNGTIRKLSDSQPTQGIGGGCVSIMGTVRVTRAQLADVTYPDEARLEVFVQNQNGGPANVVAGDTDTSTTLSVYFLG